MTILNSDRTRPTLPPPACDPDGVLHRDKNAQMPIQVLHRAASHLFERVSRHLRAGFSPANEQELTLEQLLGSLMSVAHTDARLQNGSGPLMVLIASDIRDAKQFSIESMLTARPMRAWRERYNGLEALQ